MILLLRPMCSPSFFAGTKYCVTRATQQRLKILGAAGSKSARYKNCMALTTLWL
jgi:hypothetical protein